MLMGYEEKQPLSVAAIIGIVLGAIALLTSFLPIINNGSFILGLIGAIVAIVGLVGVMRGKKRSKPLAIVSLALNVIALAVVLAMQSMYSAAIDDAVNGPAVTSTSQEGGSDNQASDDQASGQADGSANATDLAVGTSATLENGLTVTVDSVTGGLTNYDGSAITCVHVTYANNGADEAAFNMYDWSGQDAQGAQRNATYYSDANEQLDSGTLAAGGTVSGNVYFEGDLAKVLYTYSAFGDTSASWNIA